MQPPSVSLLSQITAVSLFCMCALCELSSEALGTPEMAPAKGETTASSKPIDCFSLLRQRAGVRFSCQHRAWLSEQERADLTRVSRGMLLDARCIVAVDLDRRLIEEGLVASDRTLDLPPQPVRCELQTSRGPMMIGGTFAPHVVFKEGFAIDASPGLANITGVNSYLAWPVVAYVNSSTHIRSEMAAMINEFRTQLKGT